MDLEKLKSIIRLANNNPNENEANLAARKACHIIAENDFAIFKQTRTAADKLNQHASNWGYTPTGRTRSASNPYGYSPFDDLFRNVKYKSWVDWDAAPHVVKEETKCAWCGEVINEKAQVEYDFNNHRYYHVHCSRIRWQQSKAEEPQKKQSATRKCSQCGLEVSTFRLKQEPFVCNPCSWKESL